MNGLILSLPTITVLTGGVCTLAMFSFLIRENRFYRFFEHVFVGLASGLGIIFGIKNFVWPRLVTPIFGLDIAVYPDGTLSQDYNPWLLLYLVPVLFGLLYYFVYSQRHAWIAKIVIGFSLGASGGLAFKGFFNEMVPQLTKSFKPLLVFTDGRFNAFESFSNTVFVATLLAVMYYFFFSFRRGGAGDKIGSTAGRWLLMVCFGSFFGSTVMARMALLVERLQFLIVDWWGAVIGLWK